MFGLPLAFAAPAVLAALIGLVGLYFLLRVTPPSPHRAICARSGWGMSIHRTDGSPAEMLLALRMRLSAPEPGVGLRSA